MANRIVIAGLAVVLGVVALPAVFSGMDAFNSARDELADKQAVPTSKVLGPDTGVEPSRRRLTAAELTQGLPLLGQRTVSVSGQEGAVALTLEAYKAVGGRCVVKVAAPASTNLKDWLKGDGLVPRVAVGATVASLCAGREVYLSSVERFAESGMARWEESAGPDSAAALSIFGMKYLSYGAAEVVLELTQEPL
jgi:hypothetical protein